MREPPCFLSRVCFVVLEFSSFRWRFFRFFAVEKKICCLQQNSGQRFFCIPTPFKYFNELEFCLDNSGNCHFRQLFPVTYVSVLPIFWERIEICFVCFAKLLFPCVLHLGKPFSEDSAVFFRSVQIVVAD